MPPRPAPVVRHLLLNDLFERFRSAEDPRLKMQWQVIWLRAQGKGTKEVARVTVSIFTNIDPPGLKVFGSSTGRAVLS